MVGINSQIFTRSGGFMGLSFAIPIDVALNVADQLKKAGKVSRGWLGVVIQEVNRISPSPSASTSRPARWWRSWWKTVRRPRAACRWAM